MASPRASSPSPSADDGPDGASARARTSRPRRAAAEARPRSSRLRRAVTTPEDLHVAAALIVAHDAARRIASTVRAALAIPGVDLVLVVDDASSDNTQELARKAGAVVVRHSHPRGRSASIETGASVIAMRDEPGRSSRAILLLPGMVGHHAVGAAPLVAAVTEHVADLVVARLDGGARVEGPSTKTARHAVWRASGWTPEEPLGPIRCLTREALEAAMPLAHGAGMEVAMTLDVLHAGLTVTEVECDLGDAPRSGSHRSRSAKVSRYRDVMMAISARRMRGAITTTQSAIATRIPGRSTTEEDE